MPEKPGTFRVPGGRLGLGLTVASGLLATAVSMVLVFRSTAGDGERLELRSQRDRANGDDTGRRPGRASLVEAEEEGSASVATRVRGG